MDKQIKMIVTDLDRSLLNNNKEISDHSVNILKKCIERGIIVAFATARPRRSTLLYENQINPKAVIYLNGAIVTVENEIIKRNGIRNKLTKEIIKEIEKEYPEATISAEINDRMYTNFDFNGKPGYEKIDFNDLPDFLVDKIIIGTISVDKILKVAKYLNKDKGHCAKAPPALPALDGSGYCQCGAAFFRPRRPLFLAEVSAGCGGSSAGGVSGGS